MYADKMTDSMSYAIKETYRRREIQDKYNKEHNIIPHTIIKEIRDVVSNNVVIKEDKKAKMSKKEALDLMLNIENEMKQAASNLDFERAMELRDALFELKSEYNEKI